MLTGIECPKCGKKTVVQRNNSVYQCLDCEFKKDFSEPPPPKLEATIVFWSFIIAALTLLFFWQGTNSVSNTPNPGTQTAPTSQTVPALRY